MKSLAIVAITLLAATSYADKYVVQINDAGETIPPNSIATPTQVSTLTDNTKSVRLFATNLQSRADACLTKVQGYATNLIVTSTCYAQSIGGVPYNPELQTIKIRSINVTSTTVEIVGTVAITPLIPPILDWRYQINEGGWEKLAVDAVETPVATEWLEESSKAYTFTFPKPANQAFFRIVDNSTGTSGSGLYWLVFGGIVVDGQMGYSGDVDTYKFVGGILVDSTPLGGI